MSQYEIDHKEPSETEHEEEEGYTSYTNLTLEELAVHPNIAMKMRKEDLDEMGLVVYQGYDEDETSREDWIKRYKEGMESALLIAKDKTWPWPKASNVKFPLMNLASLSFHARAYPMLVPSDGVVAVKVLGLDPSGQKAERARRVWYHMNYQVLEQMEDWEEDMDRLLITLPITGTEFKKTYYNQELKRNVSEHVFAKDLVVNYFAKDMESAIRKTHIIEMSRNEVTSLVNAGLFRDVDYGEVVEPRDDDPTRVSNEAHGMKPPVNDESTSLIFLECHCWWDLDMDGYQEPYIVTIEKESKNVARIVARFDKKGIEKKDGKVVRITPDEYFTRFTFIPSPDGSFYGLGFIHLVGSVNKAVDTLINQLIDAGTVSNLQSGFLSRSFRAKGGNNQFTPGEWKVVNASGQDLRDGVFPLPVREPSSVLFQLLGMMVDYGQRITSTTDIMVGENPGQNQKATTTNAVVENGQKVFTAVYKRIRKQLGNEFWKLYCLNKKHFDKEEYLKVLDIPDNGELSKDYDYEDIRIAPTADPNASSPQIRLQKAQTLLSMIQFGLPRGVVLKRVLQALEIENLDEFKLDQLDQQQPDPKVILEAQKLQLDQQVAAHDAQIADREQDRKEIETAIKERKINLDHGIKSADVHNKHMNTMMGTLQKAHQAEMQDKQARAEMSQQSNDTAE